MKHYMRESIVNITPWEILPGMLKAPPFSVMFDSR
jgi:hypothetical protein